MDLLVVEGLGALGFVRAVKNVKVWASLPLRTGGQPARLPRRGRWCSGIRPGQA
jgi:hypothetical protein